MVAHVLTGFTALLHRNCKVHNRRRCVLCKMQDTDPCTIQERSLAGVFEFRTFPEHAARTNTYRTLLTRIQDFHGHTKLPRSATSPPLLSLIPGQWVSCDVINLFASYWREAGPGVDDDKVFFFDSQISVKLDVETTDFEARTLPYDSHTLGCVIPVVIHTSERRQFHRGRKRLPGCVATTDAPVSMRDSRITTKK
jgi:hypothetical protein